MKTCLSLTAGVLIALTFSGCAPDDEKTPAVSDGAAESAAPFSGERVTLPGTPCAQTPQNVELLDESGALALYAGLTAEDEAYNRNNPECPSRNSLFLRRRAADGQDEWRLLLTTGSDWREADGTSTWCSVHARRMKADFEVLRARFSADNRRLLLVCNTHSYTFSVVCVYDALNGTMRVLGDGDSAEEESDGTIWVMNKKTYLYDYNGDSLGAAWYDKWITPDGFSVRKSEPINNSAYVLNFDTGLLKRKFEREWLKYVAGCTNLTASGTAKAAADMNRFLKKEWKPRILRHLIYGVDDLKLRERMVERAVKYNSVDELYYGLFVTVYELLDRWAAYDGNKNARGRLGDADIQFKNGRASWMSGDSGNVEMSATIYDHYFWPVAGGKAFAFIFTDKAENPLTECWLGLFSEGVLEKAEKLPITNVKSFPSLDYECYAPYGRKFTVSVVFGQRKAKVLSVKTGDVVFVMYDDAKW